MYAFSDGFDAAYMIRHDLQVLFHRNIPLKMFTDSKQLFDVITKSSSTTERRLMIDVAAVREAYHSFEISEVGLVRGSTNMADAFTNPSANKALKDFMATQLDNTPIVQWNLRDNVAQKESPGTVNP